MGWLKTNGYEVTERGKISVALIIVVSLFIIPAVIITAFAWSSQNQAPENPYQNADPDIREPVDTPLPENGSGFDPDDPEKNGNGEQGSFDPTPSPEPPEPTPEPTPEPSPEPAEPTPEPTPEPPGDTSDIGPVNINRTAGTMIFRFSPELQDSLDTETLSMLGDFITSPKNTDDSKISVEIPDLSRANTSAIKTAITDAFAEHGIAQNKISFISYKPDSSESSFDINLSFVTASSTTTSSPSK